MLTSLTHDDRLIHFHVWILIDILVVFKQSFIVTFLAFFVQIFAIIIQTILLAPVQRTIYGPPLLKFGTLPSIYPLVKNWNTD